MRKKKKSLHKIFVQKWRIRVKGRKTRHKYTFHLDRPNEETRTRIRKLSRIPLGPPKEQEISSRDFHIVQMMKVVWSHDPTRFVPRLRHNY